MIENKYGVGSNICMAKNVITAILQRALTGDASSPVSGGLSPYLNRTIKTAVTNKDSAVGTEDSTVST